MKTLLTTAALIAALTTAPAWAADPDPHAGHSATAAQARGMASGHSMHGMEEKLMHEMCKSVMGKEMMNKPVHEHSREKGDLAMWPNGKPLTKQEMADMHKECAAKMSAHAGMKTK